MASNFMRPHEGNIPKNSKSVQLRWLVGLKTRPIAGWNWPQPCARPTPRRPPVTWCRRCSHTRPSDSSRSGCVCPPSRRRSPAGSTATDTTPTPATRTRTAQHLVATGTSIIIQCTVFKTLLNQMPILPDFRSDANYE